MDSGFDDMATHLQSLATRFDAEVQSPERPPDIVSFVLPESMHTVLTFYIVAHARLVSATSAGPVVMVVTSRMGRPITAKAVATTLGDNPKAYPQGNQPNHTRRVTSSRLLCSFGMTKSYYDCITKR